MVPPREQRSQFPHRDTSDQSTGVSLALGVALGISVTVVFILLFCGLLCLGYFRASWQPARYGPRPAGLGQRKQSRAKGLTRAVVESLPIVRFGNDRVKDVELAESTRVEGAFEETGRDGDIGTVKLGVLPKIDAGLTVPAAVHEGAEVRTSSSGSARQEWQSDSNCLICLEEFVENEEIRLLPCNHKFHPKCVDPWLEDVSGSCPVCRYTFPVQEAENDTSTTTSQCHAPTGVVSG
ncbi:uncharacterized protein PAC_13896 [Phialocephala subalpina]|uniref:RING-type domain-containing protein n=1 Tax=Phialocephala subalpina TaxID=576137 RepID=A0A1L7XG21_9HELO|nr:uncharacterized protein PAC_13896 [Phialocephala subalpina]